MLDNNKIDLSIRHNQNILISTFAEFFTTEQLEEMDIISIQCIASNTATEACNKMVFNKDFGNGTSFKIKCVLNTESLPPTHHIRLEFSKNDIYQTYLECNPNVNNPFYIGLVIVKSVNFSKYRDKTDRYYNRRSVINNVAKRLTEVVPDFNALIYFRECMAQELYLNESYKVFKNTDHFIKDYEDKYRIHVTCIHDVILKIDVDSFKNGEHDSAYFPKSDIGLNEGLLIYDKAIVTLKDKMLENIEEGIIEGNIPGGF